MNLFIVAIFLNLLYFTIQTIVNDNFINTRYKRGVIVNSIYQWEDFPIKYEIRGEAFAHYGHITEAIKKIENETCLSFQKLDHLLDEGITFKESLNGFSSTNLKKSSNFEPHSIFLNTDSFKGKGRNYIRLVLRALGMDYEFNKPNSSEYITINKNNMNNLYKRNLNIKPKKDVKYDSKYDYGSIMHFSNYEVSKDKKSLVFETKDKRYQNTLGININPSFNDIKFINQHYCKDECLNKLTSCQNNGYQDPINCKYCRCPFFYGGQYCEKPFLPTNYKCGKGKYEAKSKYQTIVFKRNFLCFAQINAKKGKKITIKLEKGTIGKSEECKEDTTLEILYKKDKSMNGPHFCGKVETTYLKSEDNIVFLKWFDSKYDSFYKIQYKYS
ncbi:Astacin-like metalloendopeptidase [Strongyloides ratti]|uniref:Metalloendopeptidase n=1 Tax=Strongyloides ratti TaxID=34506 RepID=A0A090LRJ9_STRRB|nr:Astacin-like metalloendopeptidase [Strongyloides ratti]CEF70792.1 Astacin-like metalloendopeptidase [Strongyloides ratti]